MSTELTELNDMNPRWWMIFVRIGVRIFVFQRGKDGKRTSVSLRAPFEDVGEAKAWFLGKFPRQQTA